MSDTRAREGTGATQPREWSLRPAQEGDTDAIVSMLNRVYGYWGGTELYRWKYRQAPAPFRLSAWVAVSGDDVVGHYGMLPSEAVLKGRPVRAAQSVDGAVARAYRRQGIMAALEHEMLNQAAEAGATIIYAFPGLYSLHMHDRIGYSPFAFVPETTCVLRPRQVWRRALGHLPSDLAALLAARRSGAQPQSPGAMTSLARLRQELLFVLARATTVGVRRRRPNDPQAGPLEVYKVASFGEDFDSLWEAVAPQTSIGLSKRADYLQWRYADRPDVRYRMLVCRQQDRLVGFLVLRLHPGLQAEVCELLVAPGVRAAAGELLGAARRIARQAGKGIVTAWCARHDPLYPVYTASGFASQGRLHHIARSRPWLSRWFYQVILYVRHLPTARQGEVRSEAAAWPLVKGDSDLV